jgi:copper chaperone NosL
MSRIPRMLLLLAAGLLLVAVRLPLWRVSLVAPQYPEGLGMVIDAHTVRGAKENDLGNINALNHYIGMKAIDPTAIPELRVMPWVIVGLAVFAAGGALVGRRKVAIAWLASFAALGAVGLWDFWKWEYTYGHDLDMVHAIIKVPGMTYQPPLIGSKQLLNFTATSWPALGTYLIALAFLFGVSALVVTRRMARSSTSQKAPAVHPSRVAVA